MLPRKNVLCFCSVNFEIPKNKISKFDTCRRVPMLLGSSKYKLCGSEDGEKPR